MVICMILSWCTRPTTNLLITMMNWARSRNKIRLTIFTLIKNWMMIKIWQTRKCRINSTRLLWTRSRTWWIFSGMNLTIRVNKIQIACRILIKCRQGLPLTTIMIEIGNQWTRIWCMSLRFPHLTTSRTISLEKEDFPSLQGQGSKLILFLSLKIKLETRQTFKCLIVIT